MIILSSPNRDERPMEAAIDTLVLHYTGMRSGAEAIERLCDRDAQVSAHYVVDEDGTVYQLVEEDMRAWHAGKSQWRGRERVNDVSIGIEVVNPGHEFGYREFPEAQVQAVIGLCQDILARHPAILPHQVVGHSDIAPDRKEDPGELFPWQRLAGAGIGVWPKALGATVEGFSTLTEGMQGEAVTELARRLARFGYPVVVSDQYDTAMALVVTAFQRRFRPETLDGAWDAECELRLRGLD